MGKSKLDSSHIPDIIDMLESGMTKKEIAADFGVAVSTLNRFLSTRAPKPKLKLERPLAFFDLETTGTDVVKDRILQIAVTKVHPDGNIERKVRYVNPMVSIPQEATDVHGVTMAMVKDEPPFRKIAKSLRSFLSDCDIGGFNSTSFDVPMLQEEFMRCDYMWPQPGTRFVDALTIFHHFNKRDLSAAYKHYCKKTLENAHDAGADTDATFEILGAQIEKHDLPTDIQGLHDFCNEGRVDFAGKLKKREDGEVIFTFGKARGQRVLDNEGFANWVLDNSFPYNTKSCIREILRKEKPKEVVREIAPDDECKQQ